MGATAWGELEVRGEGQTRGAGARDEGRGPGAMVGLEGQARGWGWRA